ncbi:MAG: sulfotransferase [Planctomycetes bacterium]|nr:sulfotransferase [Planctomycetota bacterium]
MPMRPTFAVAHDLESGESASVRATSSPLASVRDQFRSLGSPVVVFCKSHSGSRLLASLIEQAGVSLGAHQNDSRDSLDLLRLVEHLVNHFYPDFSPLWNEAGGHPEIANTAALAAEVIADHLQARTQPGGRWGWKLCETAYVLPVIDFLFPDARYIHLIRDGRDVAFCNHAVPDTHFWKKVYFNTDRMENWQRHSLSHKDYHRHSHMFNAQHWVNSVRVGRSYGAMLRDRYLEVRYEDLCQDFRMQARRILDHINVAGGEEIIDRLKDCVHSGSIGKHQLESRTKRREVLQIETPLLLELGYLDTDPFRARSRSLRRRIRGLLAAWFSDRK